MSRSRAGWACSLALLSLAGCAGAGGRRTEAVPRMAAAPVRPARRSSWLGGLLARPSRADPRTEPSPAAPAPVPETVAESSLARYFPGLPRPEHSGRALPAAPQALTIASAPVPSGRDDVPMLPVALNVEVHPEADGAQVASQSGPGELPPLIEPRPDTSAPEPEPIIQVRAEAPADEPEPVIEARIEEPAGPVAPETEPSPPPEPAIQVAAEEAPAREPEASARVAAEEAPAREPEVAAPLPNIEELADAAPAPAPRAEPSPAAAPPQTAEVGPLPRLKDLVDADVAAVPPAGSPPPQAETEPAGRPRVTRPRPVPPPPISRAEQANLLFPRSYYEPGELAPIGPPADQPPAPAPAPAAPRPPSRLRRWFGRKASAPADSRLEAGDVAQGR